MIYSPIWGSRYSTILFKYISQIAKTISVLARRRPRVVFVMAPPVIACLPVWIYCLLTGSRFVIDAHSGAFDNPLWERLQFLQRFFSRRAITTIVTGEHYRDLVRAWRAEATIVTDVPVCFAEPTPVQLPDCCNLVFVSSFWKDEPTADLLRAAARFPQIQFHATGDTRRLHPQIRDTAPPNVRFTGFLDDSDYVGLIRSATGVIALTTQNHTMQRAAYEAIYLERPVITSDFPILRDAFPIGAIHVEPTEQGISDGIQRFLEDRARLETEARNLRIAKIARWREVAESLRGQLHLAGDEAIDAADAIRSSGSPHRQDAPANLPVA